VRSLPQPSGHHPHRACPGPRRSTPKEKPRGAGPKDQVKASARNRVNFGLGLWSFGPQTKKGQPEAVSQKVCLLYDARVAFVKQRAISGLRHPGRRALDRLTRLYIGHYRRELGPPTSVHPSSRELLVGRHGINDRAAAGVIYRRVPPNAPLLSLPRPPRGFSLHGPSVYRSAKKSVCTN
jgi:hypothetical protein